MNQTTIAANGTTHHSVLNARMVEEYCRTLRMPTVGASFAQLAEEAVRTHQTPISFLAALLQAEVEERIRGTIDRRIKDARLPRSRLWRSSTLPPRHKCRRRCCTRWRKAVISKEPSRLF